METRCITQVKIWKLLLNPMTGKAENIEIAVMSTDRQKVVDYYESKKVELYKDDGFNKQFEKGSLLEWFNDTRWSGGEKIEEEWVDEIFLQEQLQNDERFLK